jgi:hypothetical protein
MAFGAARVGVDRGYVGLGNLRGPMASRAVSLTPVVIVMAGDAGLGSRLRL